MCIEKSPEEKKRIVIAQTNLAKSLKSLARYYCKLILGLGTAEYHHMNGGRKRASSGFRDRGIYETLYPFCIFFIWITFKRRDYELIRKEIGRLLRSESFNSSLKVESILEDENKPVSPVRTVIHNSDKNSILSNHIEKKALFEDFQAKIDAKMSSMILNQRSPALVSILPRPEENSKQLFNRKKTAQTKNIEPDVMINQVVEDNNNNEEFEEDDDGDEYETLNEVGIIGLPIKLFHLKTLTLRGNNENDAENENKTENKEQI